MTAVGPQARAAAADVPRRSAAETPRPRLAHLPVSRGGRRRLAEHDGRPRASLRRGRAAGPACRREAAPPVPDRRLRDLRHVRGRARRPADRRHDRPRRCRDRSPGRRRSSSTTVASPSRCPRSAPTGSTGQAVLSSCWARFAAILLARLDRRRRPAASRRRRRRRPSSATVGSAVRTRSRGADGPTERAGRAEPGGPARARRSAAPPPGTAKPRRPRRTYKVKAGDTLIGIAARFGTTLAGASPSSTASRTRRALQGRPGPQDPLTPIARLSAGSRGSRT